MTAPVSTFLLPSTPGRVLKMAIAMIIGMLNCIIECHNSEQFTDMLMLILDMDCDVDVDGSSADLVLERPFHLLVTDCQLCSEGNLKVMMSVK